MRSLTSSRLGRTLLASGVAAALAVGGALVPVDAAPAEAATSGVRVVGGKGMLTAAWPRVPGATRYTVRVGTTASLTKARTVRTTKRTVQIRGLKNGRRYFVRVVPTTSRLTPTATRVSRVVRATATAAMPVQVGRVTATPGPLANQVTVSWSGGGSAAKVAVVAGSDVLTLQRRFDSGWLPATTRSVVLTVPAKYRAYLGAGTGNPVWIKVLQSNSGSKVMSRSYDYPRRLRPSPVGTWAFAKADVPAAAVTKLKVAELNIQSVGSTRNYHPVNQWAQRADRVAAYIDDRRADPDLLLTAELSTVLTSACRNTHDAMYRCGSHTQMADLARRLDRLELASKDAYARVMDQMRAYPKWAGKVTNGSPIFYDRKKMDLIDHGYFSPALPVGTYFGGKVQGLGVPGWTGTNAIGPDRWASWARFRTVSGGREFYAVAAHLPVGGASSVVTARQEEARRLGAAIDRMAGSTPVVFGSDMNADSVRNPRPAHTVFMQDGWFDAGAVARKGLRSGMKVSTANGSGPQDGLDSGYGTRPVRHPWETSRIDYILLKNSPYTFRYANVLRLDSAGRFIKSQQGTDHNMQLATIGIAGPTS
ncbi:hypothetical protein [Amnibacterium endophyticum]|uniref:Fibronectin type-III domain-containing protein n=1 Tax=Amnibacterium endophyticum TaxID=2109337 RepID=A0ABW4L9R0_9MICO